MTPLPNPKSRSFSPPQPRGRSEGLLPLPSAAPSIREDIGSGSPAKLLPGWDGTPHLLVCGIAFSANRIATEQTTLVPKASRMDRTYFPTGRAFDREKRRIHRLQRQDNRQGRAVYQSQRPNDWRKRAVYWVRSVFDRVRSANYREKKLRYRLQSTNYRAGRANYRVWRPKYRSRRVKYLVLRASEAVLCVLGAVLSRAETVLCHSGVVLCARRLVPRTLEAVRQAPGAVRPAAEAVRQAREAVNWASDPVQRLSDRGERAFRAVSVTTDADARRVVRDFAAAAPIWRAFGAADLASSCDLRCMAESGLSRERANL
jgi:hypothetical protein